LQGLLQDFQATQVKSVFGKAPPKEKLQRQIMHFALIIV
jgi:hypothetical protein